VLVLLLGRWSWRRWLASRASEGHALSRVVVVGGADDVAYVTHQIEKACTAAYTVVGAVVDSQEPETAPVAGLPTSTDIDAVVVTATELHADSVVIAGPPAGRPDFIRDLSWQ